MMFDTHCHLNFQAFEGRIEEVIDDAKKAGVKLFLVPGTDLLTSKKAVEIAKNFKGAFAAVGIHPHHVFSLLEKTKEEIENDLKKIKELAKQEKVVAIGEVGLDKHIYKKTKYEDYKINEKFLELQKQVLKKQIGLALELNKALVLHNREAHIELLRVLNEAWDAKLSGKAVFHCCEPKDELLEFAKEKQIFLGFDGDLTYSPQKQAFFKKVPLDLVVFETDSPFLTPEPARSQKRFPNEPKNLKFVVELAAYLKDLSEEKLAKIAKENGKKLFGIQN
jgi:TatD DNase family protein